MKDNQLPLRSIMALAALILGLFFISISASILKNNVVKKTHEGITGSVVLKTAQVDNLKEANDYMKSVISRSALK